MFKQSPVWDTGIAAQPGEDEVDVLCGGMTSIDIPEPNAPDMGPWGMDPRAVNVAPGTEVMWTCDGGPAAIGAHTVRQKYVHYGTLLGVKSAG